MAAAIFFALVSAGRAQDETKTIVMPDQSETAGMVWTTLIAVDHANKTGNYSVLRDLGTPSFRNANDPAQLAGIFAKLRAQAIGLNRVVQIEPHYSVSPKILDNGLFRVKGNFPFRPVGVGFDLLFEFSNGEWKLYGVSIAPVNVSRTISEIGAE